MRLKRDERGFTLTEVLVTIVILGIIIVPLGNAVIGFIRLTDSTTQRLNESHDVQIMSAYLGQDVQSLGVRDWTRYPYPLLRSVERDAPADSGLYPCGAPGTPPAVLRLAWNDPQSPSGPPDVVRVSYVEETAGTERQLHRITCRNTATPVTDLVVVHFLAATPSVTCAPDPLCTAVPESVTLSLSIKDPSDEGAALVFTATGRRRQT